MGAEPRANGSLPKRVLRERAAADESDGESGRGAVAIASPNQIAGKSAH